MKKLLKAIWKFFLKLTPKGREKLYYDAALDNMKGVQQEKDLVHRMLKNEMDEFLNKKNIRKLTVDQKELLVLDKFGKTMKFLGFRLDPDSKKLIYA